MRPFDMFMSDADAATAHWSTTVPPEVCNVAVATGDALPVALVSDVIVFAVAVPVEEAPKAVDDNGSVATAVPGEVTVPVSRNTKLPLVLIRAVTASVAALRAAVECVTAIIVFLLGFFLYRSADESKSLCFTCLFARYMNGRGQNARLSR